jgi:hypothetical protein
MITVVPLFGFWLPHVSEEKEASVFTLKVKGVSKCSGYTDPMEGESVNSKKLSLSRATT